MLTQDEARRIVREAVLDAFGRFPLDARSNESVEHISERITLQISEVMGPRQLRMFEDLALDSAAFRQEVLGRLRELNSRLDVSQGPVCRLRGEEIEGMPIHLIVAGGPSAQAQIAGKLAASRSLKEWLQDADEVIVIDPYLFKRSQEEGEMDTLRTQKDQEHADELLATIGGVRHAQFIYKGNSERGKSAVKVSSEVANRIETGIAERRIRATFNVVQDLHDRVWLKRSKGTWFARVIGTSRDGIGKRPTYMLDMPAGDCDEYMKYVDHLLYVAQKSHERPINFKSK